MLDKRSAGMGDHSLAAEVDANYPMSDNYYQTYWYTIRDHEVRRHCQQPVAGSMKLTCRHQP